MDLPAADCGRVLNKIQPVRAALPFINQQPAIQHTARPSVRVCPTCPIQSHVMKGAQIYVVVQFGVDIGSRG